MNLPSFPQPALLPTSNILGQWADRIRSWLTGESCEPPLERAVAALLVHAATLTGPLSAQHRRRITELMAGPISIDGPTAAALIDAAEGEDRRAADVHRFIRVINRHLGNEQRKLVLALVAETALAGNAGDDEKGFLRLLGGLLGISDHDRAVIQRDAQAGKIKNFNLDPSI
jgi:uncharacterized tellurite resistance protein B-like protein